MSSLTVLGEFFFLTPESTANLMVQVRDPNTNERLEETRVQVLLGTSDGEAQEIFSGQTDANGLLPVTFKVPSQGEVVDPNQVLTIIADTPNGPVQQQSDVYVGRAYNVLVTTDKPVYQPGQTIHMRGLALDTTALKAAQGQPLVVTVQDPAGNKLMRRELTTSSYGIASVDFALDTQATSGDYIITAEMGPTSSTRSVEVKPYTLPRFKVSFQSDKAFYLPGDVAGGTVDAQYFFGKSVISGTVTIKGFATDIDRFQVFETGGTTDENGFYRYEFEVPDYFVGQLENNTATVDLEITVVDTANHAESIDESVTVAEKLILIEAVPESGFLRPGIENLVYLQTSYPDGRAAQTTLTVTLGVSDTVSSVQTDEFGLATIPVTVQDNSDVMLEIEAQDSDGQSAQQRFILGASGDANAVLLRPQKAEYQIGETLNIDIHVAGNATTAYLDVIKGRQTFGLVALPVKQGLAQAAIDIDGSLLGTLELNAYVITDGGEIVRDRRLVLVNPAPAQVQVQTNAEVYQPGDTATLEIDVSRDGAPMVGALGISIVDESVFSVGTQDPGFARTYFLLERELLEPRYQIRDFVDLADDDYSPYDENPDSVRVGKAGAQDVALFGFFGEELAAMERQELVLRDAQLATPNSQLATTVRSWADANGGRIALAMPLLGLAFYDGTRKRRKLLIALVLLSLGAFVWSACAPAAAPS
ncbi:MAG: MG2 domain-containing protein, partial [Chloroflexota bacterium]|nr:MG2 domain-containing protein [Chloroflexota bacterium]